MRVKRSKKKKRRDEAIENDEGGDEPSPEFSEFDARSPGVTWSSLSFPVSNSR